MCLGGKRVSRGAVNTVTPDSPASLAHVEDKQTGQQYLVDTGAAYSVIPFSSTAEPRGPPLRGAGGSNIACWGREKRTIQLGGMKFTWSFLKAAVKFPLIGADFLRSFKLLVDLDGGNLTAKKSGYKILTTAVPSAGFFASVCSPAYMPVVPPAVAHQTPTLRQNHGPFPKLLAEFDDVCNSSKLLPAATHQVLHEINTSARPVASKYRRLDADKLAAAKEEFRSLEQQGIIRRSKSSWASPLHMVKKGDGSWRPCGDFRRLNLQTEPDKYSVPNIADLTAKLHGARVFSKLDLRKGYHQVPVKPADVPKTAICTPFGLFEFIRMPFGLKNAGQTFQRMMDDVLEGLDCCYVYMDDILVASVDEATHVEDLRAVFQRLRGAGLVLNLEKCTFGAAHVDYLGHRVSADGVAPLPSSVEAVQQFPCPQNPKQLMSYLGLLNFYRRFIPRAAQILKPLTDALKGKPSRVLQWTEHMQAAFVESKMALCKVTQLSHPAPAAEISLAVDASDTHVGAVLQQRARGGGLQPLAFYSKKLDAAQQKYSAFDRELLACYLAVRHFRHHVEGRQFHILTDHKPLTFALHRVSEPWSARQTRQLSYLAEFTADLRHVPGVENVVADALSRPPQPAVAVCGSLNVPGTSPPSLQPQSSTSTSGNVPGSSPPSLQPQSSSTSSTVDYVQMARDQADCPDVQHLLSSSSLRVQIMQVEGATLLCDVSTGVPRPLVPTPTRPAVFSVVHNLAHAGIRATRRLITGRFVWSKMAADIATWCRDCQGCARGKIHKHVHTPVQAFVTPSRRFAHLHVDLVGPLPASKDGFTHLFTVIDRTTRWPEAMLLRGTTAAECAEALTSGWIARFGVPDVITSDRGVQFTSAIWDILCKTLRIRHVQTTAYHPQSNGLIERFHRQLKNALKSRTCGVDWAKHLPWVLLGIRAAPKEDSAVSAAEMVYGTPLSLPGQVLQTEEVPAGSTQQRVELALQSFTETTRSYADVVREVPKELREVSHVYIRRGAVGPPLTPCYSGPYTVLERGPKFFRLQVGKLEEVVAADRLKPHTGTTPVSSADPPRRGRPPSKKL